MDNVVVGNLCKDPILWQPRRGGQPVARLTVAVNVRRRIGDEFVERTPVFHRVVCFGPLAEKSATACARAWRCWRWASGSTTATRTNTASAGFR